MTSELFHREAVCPQRASFLHANLTSEAELQLMVTSSVWMCVKALLQQRNRKTEDTSLLPPIAHKRSKNTHLRKENWLTISII